MAVRIKNSKKTEFVLFMCPKQNPFNIHTAEKGSRGLHFRKTPVNQHGKQENHLIGF